MNLIFCKILGVPDMAVNKEYYNDVYHFCGYARMTPAYVSVALKYINISK